MKSKSSRKLGQLVKELKTKAKKVVTPVRKPRTQLMGVSHPPSERMVSVPIAMSGVSKPSTMDVQSFMDPDRGEGLLVKGTIFVTNVTFSNGNAIPFGLYAAKRLTPIGLSGGLAKIAAQYEQYRWKSMNFRYVPGCASTTTGILRFGIYIDQFYNLSDGILPNLTYGLLSEARYNRSTAAWQPASLAVDHVPGAEFSYFQVADGSDDHQLRMTTQCCLVGAWDANATGSSAAGMIEMDYTLALYNRAPAPYGLGISEPELALEQALFNGEDPTAALRVLKDIEQRLARRIGAIQSRKKGLRTGDLLRTGGMLDVNVAAINGSVLSAAQMPVDLIAVHSQTLSEAKVPVDAGVQQVVVENTVLNPVPVVFEAVREEAPVIVDRQQAPRGAAAVASLLPRRA